MTAAPHIALTAAGLRVNGEPIALPTPIATLAAALGGFDRHVVLKYNTLYTWDDLGVVAYAEDGATVQELACCFAEADLPHEPHVPFGGQLTVDGEDALAYYRSHPGERVPLYPEDDRGAIVRGGACLSVYVPSARPGQPPTVLLSGRPDVPPAPAAPDKYVHRPLREPAVAFADFGFKLAVVQELMYTQGVLLPRFDLREFVRLYRGRAIDLEAEGYAPIAEVTQWFRDLEVPARLAPLVTELYQDGGNEVYLHLIRFPEGDEADWDIETTVDAAHFANLRTATICYGKPSVVDELRARGIDADWL